VLAIPLTGAAVASSHVAYVVEAGPIPVIQDWCGSSFTVPVGSSVGMMTAGLPSIMDSLGRPCCSGERVPLTEEAAPDIYIDISARIALGSVQ
jgi:hypothetical protein